MPHTFKIPMGLRRRQDAVMSSPAALPSALVRKAPQMAMRGGGSGMSISWLFQLWCITIDI